MSARCERIKQLLVEQNEQALLCDGYEECLLGICHQLGRPPVAAYDYNACIAVLQRDMSYEDAVEFFEFNTLGAWMGENTPVFIVTGTIAE